MLQDVEQIILKIEGYYEQERTDKVKEVIEELYPGDIAYVASHIEPDFLESFLDGIKDYPQLEEVIFLMEQDQVIALIRKLKASQVKRLFSELDTDDAVKILAYLPEDLAQWAFDHMDDEVSADAELLLEYEEESAGRIMSLDFFAAHETDTVDDVLAKIRESHEAETIYSMYVIDDRGHLVGVCSLRELLAQMNGTQLKDFMLENVISVDPRMDREEVAKVVERYKLNAVPVIDERHKLIGVITVDDVISVIRSEASEDIMRLAGTNEAELNQLSAFQGFKLRMPWLLVSFFGGMITIQTNFYFASKINQVEFLAFVTIIAGMGGNIASQSSTIVVRGLATGKIMVSELWEVLFREVAVGSLLGLFFGLMLGVVAQLQFHQISLIGLSVMVGMLFSMLIAATVGSLMPIIFQRFQIDPAVATGPFVSTTIDNLGLLGYFGSILVILNIFI